jgi:hypothetical protein
VRETPLICGGNVSVISAIRIFLGFHDFKIQIDIASDRLTLI